MKLKRLHCIIPYQLYPYDLVVSIGETDKQLFAKLKRYGHKKRFIKANCVMPGHGRAVIMPGGMTLLRLRDVPRSPEQFGLVQHEIFHVVHFLLDHIGMPLTHESSEAYTYLIQYVTEQIYKNLEQFQT